MRRLSALLVATALVLAGSVPAVVAGATGSSAAVVPSQTVENGQFQMNGQIASCAFPFTATDATGTEVTIEERPERVTTLAPSAAQTMWVIGGKEQVVGLTQYALYLDGAETRMNVSSSGFGVSVEKVVGTNPDLVLAPNVTSVETVEALRAAGLTVFYFGDATNISDVRQKTRLIGQLTGNCVGAAEANAWMTANVEAARNATADTETVTALYPLGSGFIANTGTFISAMIEAAGAQNVAGQRNFSTGYPQVSDEVILTLSPEYLVITNYTVYLLDKEPYTSLAAVENGNIVRVNVNYLNQPAPRSVVYAVRNLTKGFHPEAYAEADWVARSEVTIQTPTTTPTPTPDGQSGEATAESTTESSAEPASTQTTVAGFGAVVAVLAVLVSALLARRQ